MRHAAKLLLAGFGLAGGLALGASSARAQTKTVSGAGTGAWVRSAGIVTQAASAAMPDGGGQASDDLTGVSLGGLLSASAATAVTARSEEHTSELQSQSNLVCRLSPAQ